MAGDLVGIGFAQWNDYAARDCRSIKWLDEFIWLLDLVVDGAWACCCGGPISVESVAWLALMANWVLPAMF